MRQRYFFYAQMLWIFLIIIAYPVTGHAYLDPGTGGLLFQMGFAAISLLTGFLFVPFRFVKNAFLRIKSIFNKS